MSTQGGISGACELGRDEQCTNSPTNGVFEFEMRVRSLFLDSFYLFTYQLACRPATQTLNALCTFENITDISNKNMISTPNYVCMLGVCRKGCRRENTPIRIPADKSMRTHPYRVCFSLLPARVEHANTPISGALLFGVEIARV